MVSTNIHYCGLEKNVKNKFIIILEFSIILEFNDNIFSRPLCLVEFLLHMDVKWMRWTKSMIAMPGVWLRLPIFKMTMNLYSSG